ncbi:MAG: 50S ribosomal protein L30 [Candidatus Micrarchaeia archaeon]|jgi:large subunit ribosomal protein L30
MTKILVLRVRGSMETRYSVEHALRQLKLTRKNHCVLVEETPSMQGTIKKAKDFITWGPASKEVIAELLKKRGRVKGGKPLTDDYVAKNSKYKSIPEFAEALASNEKMSAVKGLKEFFALNPPKGGFASIKKPLPEGALGKRDAKSMAELVLKML